MSSLRPSTHNNLHPLARTDPVQSSGTHYLPQKPIKPEQHGPKAPKLPINRENSTSKSCYFDISREPLVRTRINVVF